jgi:DNA polymerase-1
MKKLLLVDGSNIVMRAAFGGDIEPDTAVNIATGLINRAARQVEASHLIIAMDANVPSWRKVEFPEYKADRTLDTSPWIRMAHEHWMRIGWYCEESAGFEADDVIATIADRAQRVSEVIALSNDSDILALADIGIKILRPENGGAFKLLHAMDVCAKYNLRFAGQLTDYKAMIGESSDNVPGVPGIGPKRASNLLRAHESLDEIIAWGGTPNACKFSKQVYECREVALTALRLVTLRKDAPIPQIQPANCLIK